MKNFMNKLFAEHRLATVLSSVLCAVLFVCANTNSCAMVHQPEMPEEVSRFSRVK